MKKMKKLTSLLLVLVMSLALAVPCFAAEPEREVIRLELDESYTDPETGYTYSFKPCAGFTEQEILAIRSRTARLATGYANGKYYYSRGVEINSGRPYTAYYNADESRGNVFAFKIDSAPSNNIPNHDGTTISTFADGVHKGVEAYLPCGQAGTFEIRSDYGEGIGGNVEMTLEGDPSLWVWYDVYQYRG
jgi:hypothetical protein